MGLSRGINLKAVWDAITGKVAKPTDAVSGNFAAFDGGPDAVHDSGYGAMAIDSKADRVLGAVVGHVATLDASGNLVDGGQAPVPFNNPTFAGTVTAPTFTSTQATGTKPFTVASTTVVGNLNADLLDGAHGSAFAKLANSSYFTHDVHADQLFCGGGGITTLCFRADDWTATPIFEIDGQHRYINVHIPLMEPDYYSWTIGNSSTYNFCNTGQFDIRDNGTLPVAPGTTAYDYPAAMTTHIDDEDPYIWKIYNDSYSDIIPVLAVAAGGFGDVSFTTFDNAKSIIFAINGYANNMIQIKGDHLAFFGFVPGPKPGAMTGIDTAMRNVGLLNGLQGGACFFDSDFKISAVGKGLYVKEGTNATAGIATLVAGTVTVSTNKVTANSRIHYLRQNIGGTLGHLGISARTAGTSFTITSTSSTETSQVAWWIVEPA